MQRVLVCVTLLLALPAPLLVAQPRDDPAGRIAQRAIDLREKLVKIRRDLHRHPELSGKEKRTAKVIAKHLRELGLTVETGVGGRGVVGVLEGGRPGPIVAYRADMDAVRAPEETKDYDFKSEVEGVRHVCGHDLHVTVALGIADVLATFRDSVPGKVKFIFQPAEETIEGARAMIADGVLDDPKPDAIYALHTAPFRVGQIAYMPGMGFAGMDRFEIRFRGKPAAGTADRALGAVRALGTLQYPTSDEGFSELMANLMREHGKLEKFVFVNAWNTDEDRSVVGSFKASNDREYPKLRMRLQGVLEKAGITREDYELTWGDPRLPGMYSDFDLSVAAVDPLARAVGKENLLRLQANIPFFGEDFAFYLQDVPGAMFLLGVSNPEKGINGLPHHPQFDLDEEALVVGTRAMATLIWHHLHRK